MTRSILYVLLSVCLGVAFWQPTAWAQRRDIAVVSFNIQFLGLFKARDNAALAELLSPYDLIFIQELVAPPYQGKFPDGTDYVPDEEANQFFEAMKSHGFRYVLSEEDTGTGERIHLNSSATEWYAAFYRPDRVKPAFDLPRGFLARDRSNHPDFERVPYAFPFRAGKADLVFISVHLKPGAGSADTARRAQELRAIERWIRARRSRERDYIILGDMNIEDCDELENVLFSGFASLNDDCRPTNTNVNGPKPYDHVMFSKRFSSREIDLEAGLEIINLVEAMRPYWPRSAGRYPGDPYIHDAFRTVYSDHHPIVFRVRTARPDDD